MATSVGTSPPEEGGAARVRVATPRPEGEVSAESDAVFRVPFTLPDP